jgi:hypothetical protein
MVIVDPTAPVGDTKTPKESVESITTAVFELFTIAVPPPTVGAAVILPPLTVIADWLAESITAAIEAVVRILPVWLAPVVNWTFPSAGVPVMFTNPKFLEFSIAATLTVAAPVVLFAEAIPSVSTPIVAALATGVDTTENNPAVSADTATTAMRCFIVFVDMFFLSSVEFEHFPISARRSFDLLFQFL